MIAILKVNVRERRESFLKLRVFSEIIECLNQTMLGEGKCFFIPYDNVIEYGDVYEL